MWAYEYCIQAGETTGQVDFMKACFGKNNKVTEKEVFLGMQAGGMWCARGGCQQHALPDTQSSCAHRWWPIGCYSWEWDLRKLQCPSEGGWRDGCLIVDPLKSGEKPPIPHPLRGRRGTDSRLPAVQAESEALDPLGNENRLPRFKKHLPAAGEGRGRALPS